jgi:hypothetical protein
MSWVTVEFTATASCIPFVLRWMKCETNEMQIAFLFVCGRVAGGRIVEVQDYLQKYLKNHKDFNLSCDLSSYRKGVLPVNVLV